MPPKKVPAGGPSKKTELKKKEKIIEDKTFGLKNKKGAKQQKFIQQVEKQVKSGGIHPLGQTDDKKKLEKEKKQRELLEASLLNKPITPAQKVEKGTDPKSVVCAFFKQGLCQKGDRCKFSHDLTIERKAEKRSLYVDMRDDEEEGMDNWNEEKLKEVVEKKLGLSKNVPTTDIICKHFLEAVEKSKYGWFWECPAGAKCIYRHALPPGFVLKKDKKKEEKKSEISLVDLIETERASLGSNQTKITLETFLAWKKRKLQEKKDMQQKAEDQKRIEFKAGRNIGLSGREMFSFNPNLAADDEDDEEGGQALDSSKIEREDDDEEQQYKELQLDLITLEATEADGTGTQMKSRLNGAMPNGEPSSSNETEDSIADTGPINENLFMDDDLDEELQNLDLNS